MKIKFIMYRAFSWGNLKGWKKGTKLNGIMKKIENIRKAISSGNYIYTIKIQVILTVSLMFPLYPKFILDNSTGNQIIINTSDRK